MKMWWDGTDVVPEIDSEHRDLYQVMARLEMAIVGAQDEGPITVVEAQVPLGEMFGFSTVLRSATQGKAQFTMEFALYRQIPQSIAEKIAEEVALRKMSAA